MTFKDEFYLDEKDGLAFFRSSNLSAKHIFSTRLGGVSTESHLSSLNLNSDRGDRDENVAENLRRFTRVLGSDTDHFVSASQVHSTDIRIVDISDAGRHFYAIDGFITREKGIVISVSVADCAPILLEDPNRRIIGALHAGWRGTASGIATKGVDIFRSLGSDIRDIRVAIGPCIHACCYEVGADFYESVLSLQGEKFADKYVKAGKNGAFYADIAAMNCSLLLDAGISFENISVSSRCTCCENELFFSHRASHGLRGTMKAAIVL